MKECIVKAEQYDNPLGCVEKKVSILYKWKPCEVNIEPYNTVILKLLKSNMNLQFNHRCICNVYIPNLIFMGVWIYNKRTYAKGIKGKDIKGKMLSIGNIFLTKCGVPTHNVIKRVSSLLVRHSNIYVWYVPTGLKNNRTRMLKSYQF